MQSIYVADPAVWDRSLGARIRQALDAGSLVVTRSVSGAVMVIANVDTRGIIETVAVRHSLGDPFATDGWPLLLGRVEATSCGLWSPTGYRSSRLATVHTVEGLDEVADSQTQCYERLRHLASSDDDPHAWLRRVPDGHPQHPCPGNHCALTMVERQP